jgi:hypothetical protein
LGKENANPAIGLANLRISHLKGEITAGLTACTSQVLFESYSNRFATLSVM